MLFRLELAAHLVNDEGCIYCKQFDLKTSPYQNCTYTFYAIYYKRPIVCSLFRELPVRNVFK